jgi:hypothetical protein
MFEDCIRHWRAFGRDRRGATAVEFGLIGIPLFFTLLGTVEAGFDLYNRNVLDNVTQEIARQIMTGAVQSMTINNQPISAAQFRTNVVCPLLPATYSCNNVIVNVQTFTEAAYPGGFYNFVNSAQSGLNAPPLSNTLTSFCIGATGAYVLLQILYPLPLMTNVFAPGTVTTFNGQKVRLLFSNAAFKNEPFPAGSYVPPSGC